MRVRIEATEPELATRSLELARGVLLGLVVHDPRLSKAIDALDEQMTSPVERTPEMKDLVDRARLIYEEELSALIRDIEQELSA